MDEYFEFAELTVMRGVLWRLLGIIDQVKRCEGSEFLGDSFLYGKIFENGHLFYSGVILLIGRRLILLWK